MRICPNPAGHIQAVGTDVAGRRQYRHHDRWRQLGDEQKHDRVLDSAAALPGCGSSSSVTWRAISWTGKGSWPRPSGWSILGSSVPAAVIRSLKRRRTGGPELLHYRSARHWRGISAAQINDYRNSGPRAAQRRQLEDRVRPGSGGRSRRKQACLTDVSPAVAGLCRVMLRCPWGWGSVYRSGWVSGWVMLSWPTG